MVLFASVTIDNPQQKDNLIQCMKILGGNPRSELSDVVLDFEGTKEQCEKIIELVEHYPRHGIYTQE